MPRSLIAIARRDLARVGAGGGGRRMLLLAFALLLPAGLIRMPERSAPTQATTPAISGHLPPHLETRLRSDPTAPTRLSAGPPVTAHAGRVSRAIRAQLDTLPDGPTVRLELFPTPIPRPRRALWIALLGLSLLTGPLAESLPGERAAGTLEPLLGAAVSRSKLLTGKWLAWFAAGSVSTLLATIGSPGGWGPWSIGLPMVLAVGVALGLRLGAVAHDRASATTRAIRVLPLAAALTAGLAWALRDTPSIAAAVPLGGPLLVAGGLLTGWDSLLGALVGTVIATALLLRSAAHALSRSVEGPAPHSDAHVGLRLGAIIAWWLAMAGPLIWGWAGNTALTAALDPAAGQLAAAALSGLLGLTLLARLPSPPPQSTRWTTALVVGSAIGATLWLTDLLPGLTTSMPQLAAQLAPPRSSAPWTAALLGFSASALWYIPRTQPATALVWPLLWAGLCFPLHLPAAIIAALAMTGVGRRFGRIAAATTIAVWLAGPGLG